MTRESRFHGFTVRTDNAAEMLQNTSGDMLSATITETICAELIDDYEDARAEAIAKALLDDGCTEAMVLDKQWLLSAIAEKAARDRDGGAGFQSWIPVTERLPEDFTRVLISVPYENHPEVQPRMEIGWYDYRYDRWINNNLSYNPHPSHWMPLPPKPEKGE